MEKAQAGGLEKLRRRRISGRLRDKI